MSERSENGVLYSEYAGLKASMPWIASLWSYETCSRGCDLRRVRRTPEGHDEYWLELTDPLLNTILAGTGVSLIVNFGDLWATGRSLATSACLPRVCVVGPPTQSRILRVGRSIRAVGVGFRSTSTRSVFGVPAAELVDQIVPLDELWAADEVERLFASLCCLDMRGSVLTLRNELARWVRRPAGPEDVGHAAQQLIRLRRGRVSIGDMARSHHLSRREFGRRFCAAAGMPPKLFARITRFQALVHALLSAELSQWTDMSLEMGFYDQAHMINEFRAFAGTPPTVFFRPHGSDIDPAAIVLRGRPSDWLGQG